MTTIAASVAEGVMCSDSFWFSGDECGPIRKVYRIRRELVGLAGDLVTINKWLEAYRKGAVLKGDCTALRLSKAGLQTWTSPDGWTDAGKAFAIGSGGKAARAAMAAGASCRRAVRIVCDIDAGTGGPVRLYRLGA
jgi:hypothetical protein